MSAQPQVSAATCGTEVTSLLRILEAPEIRTAYVKKLNPHEVTIANLALGGAPYGKTKYLVDKGQNPADHTSAGSHHDRGSNCLGLWIKIARVWGE